jgi:hypothetical protein
MGTGVKVRPGRDADHSPPSSAEVKYGQELYLLSPHVPPWNVAGQLLSEDDNVTVDVFSVHSTSHKVLESQKYSAQSMELLTTCFTEQYSYRDFGV